MINIRLIAWQKVKSRLFELTLIAALVFFIPSTYAQGIKDRSHKKGSKNMKSKQIHELPSLPYDYNELEPYYDAETLRLHHDKHHAAYVKGLNTAEEKLAEAREKGDNSLIKYWERSMAFNGSGHILHSIFWTNMAPNQSDTPRMPQGEVAEHISKDFGNFDAFKKQFSAAAASVEGSGWCMLGWMPEFNKLVILQVENHQKLTLWGVKPLLVLDMWEHAYYLRYQNRRPEWVENWWCLVNWDDVARRFTEACK